MIVPDCILVPPEAYFYVPHPHIVFHGKGKKAQRFVFTNQKFSEFELDKLTRLELELQKLKINPYEKHPNWTRSDLLRFCYGTGWKTRVAVKVLVSYLKWYESIMPTGYLNLYPKVERILDSGCLYVHGRDIHFRPIIIVDIPKFDFKKHPVQEYIYFIAFFLEYIKEHMLLPGRVENWVLITDMGHQSLGASSLSNLKQVLKVLTDNYRCRLGVNYILNPPKTVFFIWSCIKPFMDDVLIEKMKIINKGFSAELLTHANALQVEVRFGGKSRNLEHFWPPFVPDAPFSVEESKISAEKLHKNIFINIHQAEPSEISAADTKLTHSRLFPDTQCEKQQMIESEKEEVLEENIECILIEEEKIEEVENKELERQKRKEKREKRRKRKEKKLKVAEKEENILEIPAIEVEVKETKSEELEEILEHLEVPEVIVMESVKKEIGCYWCSKGINCLIF